MTVILAVAFGSYALCFIYRSSKRTGRPQHDIVMMKSLFCTFRGLVLILLLSLVSCSKDKDDEPMFEIGEIPTLPTPEYASNAACYNVTSGGNGISSIEITESGDYIVTKTSRSNALHSNSVHSVYALPSVGMTRAESADIVYGKAIKVTDTEYILEGFGTITIEGDSSNSISIIVSTEEGETLDLTTQKVAPTNESPLTSAMCRSWNITEIGLRYYLNNKLIYDGKKAPSQLVDLMNECMWAVANYVGEPDGFGESPFPKDFYPNGLILTRAGTYMVEYSNGAIALAKWKWLDEKKQIFHYSWDYDNPDAYQDGVSGDATVGFSGKQMIIRENHTMSEDGITVKTSTYYYCN